MNDKKKPAAPPPPPAPPPKRVIKEDVQPVKSKPSQNRK